MKKELKKLVAQEKLDQALDQLIEQLENHNTALYNATINLSGRYRQWKERTLRGIQESNQEINIIRDGILQLIDQLDGGTSQESTPGLPPEKPMFYN